MSSINEADKTSNNVTQSQLPRKLLPLQKIEWLLFYYY